MYCTVMSMLRRRGRVGASLLTTALLCLAASSSALQFRKRSLTEMLDSSGQVFIGTVKAIDPAAGANAGLNEPRTSLSIAVQETLMGDPYVEELTFFLPEGMLPDGTFLRIAGSPVPSTGQSYLIFVKSGQWRITPFTAFGQGLLRKVEIERKEYFVDASGSPVTAVSKDGFAFGAPIAEPSRSLEILGANASRAGDKMDELPSREVVVARAAAALTTSDVLGQLRSMIASRGLSQRSGDLHLEPSGSVLQTEQTGAAQ